MSINFRTYCKGMPLHMIFARLFKQLFEIEGSDITSLVNDHPDKNSLGIHAHFFLTLSIYNHICKDKLSFNGGVLLTLRGEF